MERRGSLVQKFMAVILAVCINFTVAAGGIGAANLSQAGNASAMPPDQLDKLLAPVALYPDALLMQVLAASVNSQEVLDGGNWLLQNKSLEGDQLDSAAKAAGFGPAMIALFHFPQVVDMMCSEIDWTKQLGEAFTASQSAVLDSVQRLRLQAKQAGNLQTTPQQTVVTQAAGTQQVIVIQPTNPQIVYVPQYNPVQVYVAPPPSQPATGVDHRIRRGDGCWGDVQQQQLLLPTLGIRRWSVLPGRSVGGTSLCLSSGVWPPLPPRDGVLSAAELCLRL